MKKKTRKNKMEIKSSNDNDYGGIKIKKIIIKNYVGCISVNNSF